MTKYLSNSEFKQLAKTNKAASAPLTKSINKPATALEGRQIKFVLSEPMVDRDYDFVSPEGIDISAYLTNPVVFWGHQHDTLPIGKCVSIGLEHGALVGVVEFVDPSIPLVGPMADAVYQLCKSGVLSAVSIGFLTKEWDFADDSDRRANGGTDITRCELIEFSVVGIPCNPGALIQEIRDGSGNSDRPISGFSA
jgi:HK97 family phage prohead protease